VFERSAPDVCTDEIVGVDACCYVLDNGLDVSFSRYLMMSICACFLVFAVVIKVVFLAVTRFEGFVSISSDDGRRLDAEFWSRFVDIFEE
jgi:hypothetical protein